MFANKIVLMQNAIEFGKRVLRSNKKYSLGLQQQKCRIKNLE